MVGGGWCGVWWVDGVVCGGLKGFRPGKVPKEILKRQFGQAIFSEVLDKVLKDTSVKALEDNKIKPAGQPKLDLKTYGEDKASMSSTVRRIRSSALTSISGRSALSCSKSKDPLNTAIGVRNS